MSRTSALFRFNLKPEDAEPWEVIADSRDVYAWERSNKGASFAKLKDDLHMGDLYSIAWVASRRQKLVEQGMTLSDFVDQHQLEFETNPTPPGDATPDPTQSAP